MKKYTIFLSLGGLSCYPFSSCSLLLLRGLFVLSVSRRQNVGGLAALIEH